MNNRMKPHCHSAAPLVIVAGTMQSQVSASDPPAPPTRRNSPPRPPPNRQPEPRQLPLRPPRQQTGAGICVWPKKMREPPSLNSSGVRRAFIEGDRGDGTPKVLLVSDSPGSHAFLVAKAVCHPAPNAVYIPGKPTGNRRGFRASNQGMPRPNGERDEALDESGRATREVSRDGRNADLSAAEDKLEAFR